MSRHLSAYLLFLASLMAGPAASAELGPAVPVGTDIAVLPRYVDPQGFPYVLLGDVQVRLEDLPQGLQKGAYIPSLWPGSDVYYQFDGSVTAAQRDAFRAAASDWAAGTMLQFIESDSAPARVHVVNAENNPNYAIPGSAELGYKGRVQNLTVKEWSPRTILHEIGHALGFIHEHQRGDRNQYITVSDTTNLAGREPNSFWVNFGQVPTLGASPYDFASVMHYHFSTTTGVLLYANTAQPPGPPGGSEAACSTPQACESVMGSSQLSPRDRYAAGLAYQVPGVSTIPEGVIAGADDWKMADFNGDGRSDVIFWFKASGLTRLYLRESNGTYLQRFDPIDPGAINGGDQWKVGDFNADGRADLLFWFRVSGTNRLYLTRADGTFDQILDPLPAGGINGGDEWKVADFNGDGATDAYFWFRASGANRLYLSGGNGTFSQILDPIGPSAINDGDVWEVGDFNGDGRQDAFFWFRTPGTNRLFLSGSAGTFTPVFDPIEPSAINGGDQWRVGDFDGDGRDDVFFWERVSGVNRVFLAAAGGGFQRAADPAEPGAVNGGDELLVGDFDNNGRADLYFWFRAPGTNRLYLSVAAGFEVLYDPITDRAINDGEEWKAGDIDGDGRDDLFFWFRSTGVNRLFAFNNQRIAETLALTSAVFDSGFELDPIPQVR